MDAKYAGKSVILPKDISDKLEGYRQKLSSQLGFKVSLSDAIGRLVKMEEDLPDALTQLNNSIVRLLEKLPRE